MTTIDFPSIVDQVVQEGLAPKRYGDRDAFRPGNLVERPDGSRFIQGDLSTYRVARSPEKVYPSGWVTEIGTTEALVLRASVATENHDKRHEAAPESGSGQSRYSVNDQMRGNRFGQPGYSDDPVHYEPIPSKTVYHDRYIERVYEGPGGVQAVFRRLRHSTEMPGTYPRPLISQEG